MGPAGRAASAIGNSRSFWNQKAKENPYWYVSSCGSYENRDLAEFWASGSSIWRELKSTLGYHPARTDVAVEIGCGVGRITRAIARDVREVHAFDISGEMVEIARGNALSNTAFQVNDGTSLDLPASFADLVVAYCVFQHLPDIPTLGNYLQEIKRVAKPRAAIFFTTSARDWKDNFRPLMQIRALLKGKLGLQPPGLHEKAWLGIRPSRQEVRRICPFPIDMKALDSSRWLCYGYR